MRTDKHSVSHIIKITFALICPVVLLDICLVFYIGHQDREQLWRSAWDTVQAYTDRMNKASISVNKFLIRLLRRNEYVPIVLESEDMLSIISASDKLAAEIEEFLEAFLDIDFQIFCYSIHSHKMSRLTRAFQTMNYQTLEAINRNLTQYMEKDAEEGVRYYSNSWQDMYIDGQIFFYKIFGENGLYAGAFISARQTTKLLEKAIGESGSVSIADRDGKYYYTTNEPVLLKRSILRGDNPIFDVFTPVVKIKGRACFFSVISLFLPLALFTASASLFFSWLYTKRRILDPLRHFSQGVRGGNMGDDLTHMKMRELEEEGEEFKNLISEIEKLKTDMLKKEREKQRILMSYFQLQIRPHFFLNCLSTIHSMALLEAYDDIKEMALITSNYFRYIFSVTDDFVPIQAELDHVSHYMSILKLRMRGETLTYSIHIDPQCRQILVLPLLLQTFVENAVKHGRGEDIRIDITLKEDEQRLCIIIGDRGQGFKDDILEQLNTRGGLSPRNGHHIGITNTLARLNLFYGEGRTQVSFMNQSRGGALVSILLPVDPQYEDKK